MLEKAKELRDRSRDTENPNFLFPSSGQVRSGNPREHNLSVVNLGKEER